MDRLIKIISQYNSISDIKERIMIVKNRRGEGNKWCCINGSGHGDINGSGHGDGSVNGNGNGNGDGKGYGYSDGCRDGNGCGNGAGYFRNNGRWDEW